MQLWKPWKNLPNQGFFSQNSKKFEILYKFSKKVFPPKHPRIRWWQISQSLKVKNNRPESRKEFFSLEKMSCYIVLVDIYCSFGNTEESLPPLSQKLQYNSGKSTSLRNSFLKFCSVSVPLNTLNVVLTPLNIFFVKIETKINQSLTFFPVKVQLFLVKVQKRRKTICSTFFLCTLRLLFRHYLCCQNQKKTHSKSKKRW